MLIKWFSNLKIFSKVLVLTVFLLIIMFGMGVRSIIFMDKSHQEMVQMHQEYMVPLNLLATRLSQTTANDLDLAVYLSVEDPARMQDIESRIRGRMDIANRALNAYRETHLSEIELQLLAEHDAAASTFREIRNQIFQLSKENKLEEARALYAKAYPYRDKVVEATIELINLKGILAEEALGEKRTAHNQSLREFIIIRVIASIFAFGLAFFLARTMSRPLKTLEGAAGQVAEGDLRVEWVIRSRDEIGSLSASLTKMIQNLRLVVQQVNKTSFNVAASAEELTASTEQSAAVSAQLARAAQEVASGAEQQNNKVQTVLAAIQRASAATEQIAATAQAVTIFAQDTNQQAHEGNRAMAKAMAEMERISISGKEMAGSIKELGNRSKDIGQIIDVISGISGQTNLLALNAAIEAARAGDHGRGFAVVAEEVRKLAEQSSKAAKEIVMLIRQIQGETDRVMQAIDGNLQLVENGNIIIGDGATAFQQIEQAVASVAKQLTGVYHSTEGLTKGNEEILKAINEIKEVTQNASVASQEMAASTQEQAASIEELAASAEELARLGHELQKAVATFKL